MRFDPRSGRIGYGRAAGDWRGAGRTAARRLSDFLGSRDRWNGYRVSRGAALARASGSAEGDPGRDRGVPEYRERFLREARLAASVDHPHVVSVYDVGESDKKLFLAMQWVDGVDLKRLLETSGCLPPERAVAIVTQVANALDAVHSVAGLVHRDVKPANVLVRVVAGRDHAYLTDFGIARPSEATDQLTKTGWMVGTTGYLSPEQIKGQKPGGPSDLYALGCLLFESLTGQPPFRAKNDMALRWAHANDPRPIVSAVASSVGQRYDDFLVRALAVDPESRFASGRQFAEALAAVEGGKAPSGSTAVIRPHEPTAVAPATPMPPPHTPVPGGAPAMYAAYGYVTPVPPPAQTRSGNPLVLIVLGLVALAGIAVGALAVTGVFSRAAASATSVASRVTPTRTITTVTTLTSPRTAAQPNGASNSNPTSPRLSVVPAATAALGSWRGTVTQHTPHGTQQEMAVTSTIRKSAGVLVGEHSETTVSGVGTGQHCGGQIEEMQRTSRSVSFAYTETLDPTNCIAHTTLTLTPSSRNVLRYLETYVTSVGPGRLTGRLTR